MQEFEDKQDRIDKAISRRIEWSYVEKIDKARHDILDVILDEKSGKLRKAQRTMDKTKQNKRDLDC